MIFSKTEIENIKFLIAKQLQYKKLGNPNKHETCWISQRLGEYLVDEFSMSTRYRANEEAEEFLNFAMSNSFADGKTCFASNLLFNLTKPKYVEINGETIRSAYKLGLKFTVQFIDI